MSKIINALLNAVEPLWDFLKDVDPFLLFKFLITYYRLPKGRSRGEQIIDKRETYVVHDLKNQTIAKKVIEYFK